MSVETNVMVARAAAESWMELWFKAAVENDRVSMDALVKTINSPSLAEALAKAAEAIDAWQLEHHG